MMSLRMLSWTISLTFLPLVSIPTASAQESECRTFCIPKMHCRNYRRCYEQPTCYPTRVCRWVNRCEVFQEIEHCYKTRRCWRQKRCTYRTLCKRYRSCVSRPFCRKICRSTRSPEDEDPSTPPKHTPPPQKTTPLPPPTRSLCGMNRKERQVFTLINAYRQRASAPPLRCNPKLLAAARSWSRQQCRNRALSHRHLSARFRATRVSYTHIAENVAAGQQTASSVVNSWMNSPGHRLNIMNPIYNYVGIGVALCHSQFPLYWTQMFARIKTPPIHKKTLKLPPKYRNQGGTDIY